MEDKLSSYSMRAGGECPEGYYWVSTHESRNGITGKPEIVRGHCSRKPHLTSHDRAEDARNIGIAEADRMRREYRMRRLNRISRDIKKGFRRDYENQRRGREDD